MKQREIYWADLNPVKGSEQSGKRPVVIISGNTMNENFPVCIVCPLTTSVKNFSNCVVLTKSKYNNLSDDSEVITFQVRTLSQDRLLEKIGEITPEELEKIFEGLSDTLRY